MISTRLLLIALVFGLAPAVGSAQHHASGTVHLNQNATYPNAPKVAVVVGAKGGEAAQVVSDLDGRLVWEGTVEEPADYHWSGESVGIVRFDDIQEVGMYRVHVEGLGTSEVIEVRPNAFEEATRLSLRALYLQRASVALPVEFAGVWQRDAGHPDDQVIIHPSAASEGRPAGSTISAPGGWYDAGDYNKYVVPAAVTSYYLFGALESFPSAVSELDLGIPESANGAPDIVDEAVWNLRWMMRMQDPADGGLYHKLTHASFQGWLMPKDVTAPRYVVQKTTNAALTYAAALAQAARFLPAYPEYQSLADSCLAAARRAWAWAEANPAVTYDQNAMNAQHDPDISTGPYADGEYDDERAWAGVELALATGDATFLDSIDFTRVFDAPVPYWEIDTGQLALRSLYEGTGPIANTFREQALAGLRRLADHQLALSDTSAYGMPINERVDFIWGGTSVASARAGILFDAAQQFDDRRYAEAGLDALDYLLGRNPTGFSFVTGLGEKSPHNPHHRPTVADGVEPPVPGMLVGGPTHANVTDCPAYPSEFPAARYVDAICSYSANEITTYWNATFSYATAGAEGVWR